MKAPLLLSLLLVTLLELSLRASPAQEKNETTAAAAASTTPNPKRIHVVVALCDNTYQGIQPVGARIGDGDKPDDNLYWGCSDGLREWFKNSPAWILEDASRADLDTHPEAKVLRNLVFRHKESGARLTAEAWRGRHIRAATLSYFEKLSDSSASAPDLVAYIGHNGLMDFALPAEIESDNVTAKPKASIVLCCRSRAYFETQLAERGATPLLLTDQLMYPGAFLLEAALEGWLKGESPTQLRDRAARAYQRNQKISFRAARGIFSDLAGGGGGE